MRRFLLLLALLALPGLGPGSAAATSNAPPRDDLTAFACHRALDPPNRAVSVTAVMRPVQATRKLSLKFDLLEKAAGVTRTLTGAGDLGIWLSPKDPTLGQRSGDVWELNKAVYNLGAPASYRFRVSFRWLGVDDKVLATAVTQSGSCLQRELRADLLVRSVSVAAIPNKPRERRYTALIADRGASAAGPFQVLFTPGDGSAPQTRTVARVDAHSSLQLSFVGPLCDASSPPTVVADSTDQVDDSDRDNNAMTVTCPA
jgi:CARDB protein